MVKAYLRYRLQDAFGIVASTECNVASHPHKNIFFTGASDSILVWDTIQSQCKYKLTVRSQDQDSSDKRATVTRLEINLFHPSFVAAGYSDGKVRIWNWETSEIIFTFTGHGSHITSICYSYNGAFLCTGSADREILIWDVFDGVGKFRLPLEHVQAITGLEFLYPKIGSPIDTTAQQSYSCNPSYVLSSSLDGTLKVWDINTQACVHTMSSQSVKAIHAIALTSSQTHVIVGLAGKVMEVFELRDSKLNNLNVSHTSNKPNLVFSGTLSRSDAANRVASINILGVAGEIESFQSRRPLRRYPNGIFVTDDGSNFIVTDQRSIIFVNGFAKHLDVILECNKRDRSKREIRVLLRRLEKYKKKSRKLTESSEIDDKLRALLGSDWTSSQSEIEKQKMAKIEKALDLLRDEVTLKKKPKIVNESKSTGKETNSAEKLSARAKRKREDSDDSEDESPSEVAEANTCATYFKMLGEPFSLVHRAVHLSVGSLYHSNRSTELDLEVNIYCSTANNLIEHYILQPQSFFLKQKDNKSEFSLMQRSTKSRSTIGTFNSLPSSPSKLAVSPDDRYLMALSSGGISIFSTITKKLVWKFDIHNSGYDKSSKALCGAFLSDNRHIVAGDKSGIISMFQLSTMERVTYVKGHEGSVDALALGGYSTKSMISAGSDLTLKKWRFNYSESNGVNIEEEITIDLPDKATDIKVSMNKKYVGVTLLNNTCLLLYEDSLKVFLTFYGHSLPVTSLDISTDGQMLVTGSADRYIKIWDTEFGNILRSLLCGREGVVTNVKFIYDTHYIITVMSDGHVLLWDGDTGDRITTLFAGTSCTCLATTADAELIFVGCNDKGIRAWERTSEQLFLVEEREREYQDKIIAEASRNDLALPTSASRLVTMEARATRKDFEAIKSIEKLIQITEDAMEESALFEGYLTALAEWEANPIAPEHLKPSKPVHKPELKGRRPAEHVLQAILSIRSELQVEILLGLPFKIAEHILNYLEECLREMSEFLEQPETEEVGPLIVKPAQVAIQATLTLVHAHINQFSGDTSSLKLLTSLNQSTKKLLNYCTRIARSNHTALKFLAREDSALVS